MFKATSGKTWSILYQGHKENSDHRLKFNLLSCKIKTRDMHIKPLEVFES